MTKQELIEAIKPVNASKAVVEQVIDALGKVAQEQLANGGEVTIPGIGKLTVAEKSARKGRNPKTGEEIDIPAKRVPKFSAAKALKDAVAG